MWRWLLVSDVPAPMPWYRVAGLEEGVAGRSGAAPRVASYAALVHRAAEALAPLPAEEQARLALLWTAGWAPEEPVAAGLARDLASGSSPLASVLHALAGPPDRRPVPPPPLDDRIEALLGRAAATPAAGFPLSGESFPGEAAVARGLLSEGAALDAESFVRRAYELILGRPADEEGLANATRSLAEGSITRAHLLHELLWSDELRSAPVS